MYCRTLPSFWRCIRIFHITKRDGVYIFSVRLGKEKPPNVSGITSRVNRHRHAFKTKMPRVEVHNEQSTLIFLMLKLILAQQSFDLNLQPVIEKGVPNKSKMCRPGVKKLGLEVDLTSSHMI